MDAINVGGAATGRDGEHATFCRICEACCGLRVKVERGRVVSIKPDRDNPLSQGHVCVKGVSFADVVYDPDRVTQPLRRVGGPGEFVPVSWDEALDDIGARLRAIVERDGGDALAFYAGHPTSFTTDTALSHTGFMMAMGSRKAYGPSSQDGASRLTANYMAFGAALPHSVPDLPNADFLLMLGANPLVSNGSFVYAPRIRHDLDAIAQRGRVIVVDPRRSETAQRYEHVPVRPGTDVWLLLALLKVLFEEGLVDREAVARDAVGLDRLEAEVSRVDIAAAAARTGVAESTLRDIARGFAAAPRAAVYGRLGLCRNRYATLSNFLVTALSVVAGKFGVRGGTIFGYPLLAGSERARPGGYDEMRSRVGNIPSVAKFLPSATMQDDILAPGPGRVRGLFVTAGNPVLAAPGGARLEAALRDLELLVSFDFYVNETGRFAHYVLPATTFLERTDLPHLGMGVLTRPFLQLGQAVIPPVGEARHEHEVYREIVRRAGLHWPVRDEPARGGAREGEPAGQRKPPIDRMDTQLRMGPVGDQFGQREGWSFERLRQHPSGVMVEMPDPTENWRSRLAHPDGKLRLWHDLLEGEFDRLRADGDPPSGLRLIGRRDIRSINNWMHNVERLVRNQAPALLIHADDAARHGLSDDDMARVWTRSGEIRVKVSLSDEVAPGTVSYPHGWGHQGGWSVANATDGANVNALLGDGPDDVEAISGTTLIDAIAVQIARVD